MKQFGLLLAGIGLLLAPLSAGSQSSPDATQVPGQAPAAESDSPSDTPALAVIVTGVEGELLSNVTAFLRIAKVAAADEPLPQESRLRWLHKQAEEDIRQAVAPFGYYQPTIEGEFVSLPDNRWSANYQVELGEPIPLVSVDIALDGSAADDPSFVQYLATEPLTEGQSLNHQAYEKVKQQLVALATERGYFDARFEQNQIRVDLEAYTARITLHYISGQRYRLGEVRFEQDVLADDFLKRYVQFQTGDPYEATTLLQLQSDLIDSEYFSEVSVSAPVDGQADGQNDKILPVIVAAQPRKSNAYSVGLGFGTDSGVRARGGLSELRVNEFGHRYDVQLLLSQIQYTFAASYTVPGEDPRTDSIGLRSQIDFENSDVKESLTAGIGVTQQAQDGPWLKINSLDYQWERFNFGGEDETTALLIAGLNWSRIDAAPDRITVTDGSRFGFELRGSLEQLLSDISFAQAVVRFKWIKSLNDTGRIITRGAAGATYVADEDFSQLPSSLRFFAGGDASVRGFSLDAIGPEDDDGEVIGGRYLTVGSLEYEHRILEKWSVAAFVDVGDAFDNSPQIKTGVGLGLRWQSPVGPVRVDVASGLDDPGDTVRLHISVGPDL